MQISGDSAAAVPPTPARPSEKCLLFAFNADCDDDDDCVISPGEPLARSLVSIMELTRSPINLDVYTLATLHYGGARAKADPASPGRSKQKGE